jgi:hypothetical protein
VDKDVVTRWRGRRLAVGLLLVLLLGAPAGEVRPAAQARSEGPGRAVPFLVTRELPARTARRGVVRPEARRSAEHRRHRARGAHRERRHRGDGRRRQRATRSTYLFHRGRVTPSDLWHVYGEPYATARRLPVPGPRSPIVAVVASGGYAGRVYRDLTVFRRQFGLPACRIGSCFTEIGESGATAPLPPADGADWWTEASVDVEAISATCPECRIVLADATPSHGDAGLVAAAQAAVDRGARYVAMSFGWGDPGAAGEVPGAASLFATPGVLFAAATGDAGYAGSTLPAGAAGVIAVGGLRFTPSADRRSETFTAWSQGGSGCSRSAPASSGQLTVAAATATCAGAKAESDVSSLADPATGLMTYLHGSWALAGGTSTATPLIVGLYAAARNHTDPWVLYANAGRGDLVRDVTAGRTGSCSVALLCRAAPGWDAPTGVGTPVSLAALRPRE